MSKPALYTTVHQLPSDLQDEMWLKEAFTILAVSIGNEATLLTVPWEKLYEQFVTNELSCIAVVNKEIIGHMTCWPLVRADHDSQLPWVELGTSYIQKDYRHTGLFPQILECMDLVFFHKINAIAKSLSASSRASGRKYNATIPIFRSWLPMEVLESVCSKCSPNRMRAEHYLLCKRAWGEQQCDASLGPNTDACVFRATVPTHTRQGYPVAPYPEDFEPPKDT